MSGTVSPLLRDEITQLSDSSCGETEHRSYYQYVSIGTNETFRMKLSLDPNYLARFH